MNKVHIFFYIFHFHISNPVETLHIQIQIKALINVIKFALFSGSKEKEY